MRTIQSVTATQRCGHCSLPEALHTTEQKAACEKRLLADLSRTWPRTMKTPTELAERSTKKVRLAVGALSEVTKHVQLDDEGKRAVLAALDVLGAVLARKGAA